MGSITLTRPPLPPCSRKRWGRIPTPVTRGGQGRPPLQGRTGTVRNGTTRTPSPTHSVIARSEATRQSVLPSPKKRIPAPVTRSLARNGSAPRRERRDTRVPPYGVRRSSKADRVVRPYKAEQEPRETGRRTPRAFVPLRSTAGRRALQGLFARERAAPVGAALFFIVIAPMRR